MARTFGDVMRDIGRALGIGGGNRDRAPERSTNRVGPAGMRPSSLAPTSSPRPRARPNVSIIGGGDRDRPRDRDSDRPKAPVEPVEPVVPVEPTAPVEPDPVEPVVPVAPDPVEPVQDPEPVDTVEGPGAEDVPLSTGINSSTAAGGRAEAAAIAAAATGEAEVRAGEAAATGRRSTILTTSQGLLAEDEPTNILRRRRSLVGGGLIA